METKEDYTESCTYMVDIYDNGITLNIPEQDLKQVEKFCNDGKIDDAAIIEFLGRQIWEDIYSFANERTTNNIKIDMSISDNK